MKKLLFILLLFSSPVLAAPRVLQSEMTPDGSRLVELADYSRATVFEVWQTPSTPNGQRSRVGPIVPSAKDVERFLIAPDSSRVVWLEIDTAHGGSRLLSSNWSSSVAALLLTLDEVRGFTIMCDSKNVSLTGAKIAGDFGQSYCVPITGGIPTEGWCALPNCRTIFIDGFENGGVTKW